VPRGAGPHHLPVGIKAWDVWPLLRAVVGEHNARVPEPNAWTTDEQRAEACRDCGHDRRQHPGGYPGARRRSVPLDRACVRGRLLARALSVSGVGRVHGVISPPNADLGSSAAGMTQVRH
jgi:hypothetical protein